MRAFHFAVLTAALLGPLGLSALPAQSALAQAGAGEEDTQSTATFAGWYAEFLETVAAYGKVSAAAAELDAVSQQMAFGVRSKAELTEMGDAAASALIAALDAAKTKGAALPAPPAGGPTGAGRTDEGGNPLGPDYQGYLKRLENETDGMAQASLEAYAKAKAGEEKVSVLVARNGLTRELLRVEGEVAFNKTALASVPAANPQHHLLVCFVRSGETFAALINARLAQLDGEIDEEGVNQLRAAAIAGVGEVDLAAEQGALMVQAQTGQVNRARERGQFTEAQAGVAMDLIATFEASFAVERKIARAINSFTEDLAADVLGDEPPADVPAAEEFDALINERAALQRKRTELAAKL